MLVIRAFAALMVALALLVIAAPAHACDERVTPDCNRAPMLTNDADNESNYVRRVPLRDTRGAARAAQKKSERAQAAEKRAVAKRKPVVAEDAVDAAPAQPAIEPKPAKPQIAEVPSAEPVFPIEFEAAPVVRPTRLAFANVGQSFDRDLSSEPEVAPRLSAEAAPRILDVAEVSPTGAGVERRSPSLQLAMKQEAERYASAQEPSSRVETAPEPSFQLGPLRTAFLAFGGLLLLGTAARMIMG